MRKHDPEKVIWIDPLTSRLSIPVSRWIYTEVDQHLLKKHVVDRCFADNVATYRRQSLVQHSGNNFVSKRNGYFETCRRHVPATILKPLMWTVPEHVAGTCVSLCCRHRNMSSNFGVNPASESCCRSFVNNHHFRLCSQLWYTQKRCTRPVKF